MNQRQTNRYVWTVVLAISAMALLMTIIWVQYQTTSDFRQQMTADIDQLSKASAKSLGEEKMRQEALKLRLDNEQRSMFLHGVMSSLSTSVGLVVALVGMWVGFAQYLGTKDRERLDRASSDLEKLWEGVAKSDNPNAQAAAIAALQHFLSLDKSEYHDRVAAALALVSRMKNRAAIVSDTLRPVVEKAMREITPSMQRVSWQGAKIDNADFSGINLSQFDLRDSSFVEARFRGTRLAGARLDAANLARSDFEGSDMQQACLEYANLADACLRGANLTQANLLNLKVQNLDIGGAVLTQAQLSPGALNWKLVKDWRSAQFSAGIKEELLERYGRAVEGPRVLMLLWEFLPNVSGGLWTAVYHLMKTLRSRGVDLWVAIPHAASDVSFEEFGNEIHVLALGGKQATQAKNYTSYSESGRSGSNVYSQLTYDGYAGSGGSMPEWFTKVALEAIERDRLQFDIVHAHDWITFPAARAIATRLGCPWIAHFHSTETDRRAGRAQAEIEEIEREACALAQAIVCPSGVTRDGLVRDYGVSEPRIQVIPNCLSVSETVNRPPVKNREQRKVVFLGRLTSQKGPDRFVEIAKYLSQQRPEIQFVAYGGGELLSALKSSAKIPGETIVETPPPEVIPATQQDSPQRLGLSINIERIWAAALYPDSDHPVPFAEKTGAQGEDLINFVLTQGFTAYCHEVNPHTHYIRLNPPLPEGVRDIYCIRANGLRGIKRRQIAERETVRFPGNVHWWLRKEPLSGASLVIVPSRSEPFGMVILEAMELGVPVLFEASAGVGEVLKSGIPIHSEDIQGTGDQIVGLLADERRWLDVAQGQLNEMRDYSKRDYAKRVVELWAREMGAEKGQALRRLL